MLWIKDGFHADNPDKGADPVEQDADPAKSYNPSNNWLQESKVLSLDCRRLACTGGEK